MDTLQSAGTDRAARTAGPFRVRLAGEAAGAHTREAAADARRLGFDAVVFPCPFLLRDGLLACDETAGAPYGGAVADALARLGAARSEHAVAVLVDLPVDAASAGSPLHLSHPDWFAAPEMAGVLDPRAPLDLARAPLRPDAAATDGFARYLAGLVLRLHKAGIDGVRLGRLGRLPAPVVSAALRAIRAAAPGALLIGDTAGADWALLRALPAGVLDYTVASNAWWDWREAWLFSELSLLRAVAPPLLSLAVADAAAAARDTGLALSLGAGWIVTSPTLAGREAEAVRRANEAGAGVPDTGASLAGVATLSAPGAPVLAVLRTDGVDPRASRRAVLTLLNTARDRDARLDPATILPAAQDMWAPFTRRGAEGGVETLRAGRAVSIAPGALVTFAAERLPGRPHPALVAAQARQAADTLPRVAIENLRPAVDGGQFAVKRIAGEVVPVSADLICDGHDKIAAAVQWRAPGSEAWEESRLVPAGNDSWQGSVPLQTVGLHHWRIVAWRDHFATFRDELAKKHEAGVPIALELREGEALVRETLEGRADGAALLAAFETTDEAARRELLLADTTNALMVAADPRPHLSASPAIPLEAERIGAGFASWYEVFPRSLSDDPDRHGTFHDVMRHLPRIRDMGFDVLYFPPIHPIGRTNRKGPNNTLTPEPGDPGSPYAIGAAEGGHDAIHPELGTFEDFRELRARAADHGLEVAIDFAIQCSPDHPWLREHKGWFTWRPDGTIRYAENPPKKYQDIVNVDFYAADAVPDLWVELARVVLFWCDEGVRLFRVDNPHTKAFPFWQWMIAEVRGRFPDAVFLAEAFTRPKVMARLAKVGFSQSYTYFAWRNTAAEIRDYMVELADGPGRDFYRPHFFVNTPDINPFFLQTSGRPGFLIRAALAATLSGLWGVYNGFELCEGTPLAPGKEEYLDSEKFQLRAWDWNRPGNIVAEITALNRIRRENPALRSHLGIQFCPSSHPAVLCFEKATPSRDNVLIVLISVDPNAAASTAAELPLWRSGLSDGATIELEDLLDGGRRFALTGKNQQVTLTPDRPYAVWRLAAR